MESSTMKKHTGYHLFQKHMAGRVAETLADKVTEEGEDGGSLGNISKITGNIWKGIGAERREHWNNEAQKIRQAEEGEGEKTFVCTICDKRTFKKEKAWKNHEKYCGKELSCRQCGASFRSAEGLKRHSLVHTAPSVCEDCGKPFGSLQGLHRHMLTHSKIKEHTCTECPSKFTLQSNLVKHVKKYHEK